MNLTAIKNSGVALFKKGALIFRKIRPEVFTYGGIALGASCVVAACIQTTKLEEKLDKGKERLDAAKERIEERPETRKQELIAVYAKNAGDIFSLYAVPAALGGASVALILGGHHVLRKENAAITAAYMALSESYRKYRERVIADQGMEKHREYYYGLREEEQVEVDEDGNVTTKNVIVGEDQKNISIYARMFDETNPNYHPNPQRSLMFLRQVQNTANDMLKRNGHLFLNEVYDMLGYDRTEAGQYVGWVEGMGDNFVDFGIYDLGAPMMRRFVNSQVDALILDFNVDGPIMYIFDKMWDNEEHEDLKTLWRRVKQ